MVTTARNKREVDIEQAGTNRQSVRPGLVSISSGLGLATRGDYTDLI
jgi:hypothetical protein